MTGDAPPALGPVTFCPATRECRCSWCGTRWTINGTLPTPVARALFDAFLADHRSCLVAYMKSEARRARAHLN